MTGFNQGQYELYFPGDGKTKCLPSKRVKSLDGVANGVRVYRRGDMLKRVFFDDGSCENGDDMAPGIWLVRSIQGNEYFCVRSPDCKNKHMSPNSMNFDIGYVIDQVSNSEQNERNKF